MGAWNLFRHISLGNDLGIIVRAFVYESECCNKTRHLVNSWRTGKLESAEHLLLYNQIELAITESKKEGEKKTSGAVSCGGYKSERGYMKMSQRFSRTVSVIGPLHASSVKSTWGNGRNGTEQRALEGKRDNSEWRGRAHTWETLWDNIGDRNAVLAEIKVTYSFVSQESTQEITLISRETETVEKLRFFLFFLKAGLETDQALRGCIN